jgi:hypothetical protein
MLARADRDSQTAPRHPPRVLQHLAWLAARYPCSLIQEKLAYLQKREVHMQYPIYQEAGWPIGSGSVEARLKGAGMRWGAAERQPRAGAAQCRLQSRLGTDLADLGGTATSAAHEAEARTESTAARACRVVPCLLGSTNASAVSSLWGCCSHDDGTGHREATHGPSRRWVLLAQAFSPASSFHLWCYSRALCKKMKHTRPNGWAAMLECICYTSSKTACGEV